MNHANPPARAERLVKWSLAPWERSAVMGDLQEEFRDLVVTAGEPAARHWYWRQAVASTWPNLRRRLQGDDARETLWSCGMQSFASGCVMLAGGLLPRTISHHLDSLIIGTAWIGNGLITIAQSLFRRRVVAPAWQARALLWFFLITNLVIFFAPMWLPAPPYQTLPAILGTWFALQLWPWWPADPPPREFLVGRKADSEQDTGAFLTITVPNAPLALSGLVLMRAAADAVVAAPRPVRRGDPTIDRAFTPADAVRVCAIVNLTGPAAHATVDVVDARGRIARTVETTAASGALEQVVRRWDDIADHDRAEHFGQVDVTLPLANLAPGAYRLRVTATDSTHTIQREEAIVVRATRS